MKTKKKIRMKKEEDGEIITVIWAVLRSQTESVPLLFPTTKCSPRTSNSVTYHEKEYSCQIFIEEAQQQRWVLFKNSCSSPHSSPSSHRSWWTLTLLHIGQCLWHKKHWWYAFYTKKHHLFDIFFLSSTTWVISNPWYKKHCISHNETPSTLG